MLKSNAEIIQLTCEDLLKEIASGEGINIHSLSLRLGYIKGLAEVYVQLEREDEPVESVEPELQGSEAKDFIK